MKPAHDPDRRTGRCDPDPPLRRARRPSPGCRGSTRSPAPTSPILGVPFDSGVSYRPGARFGPGHIRASSKLLRPYNPAQDVHPFGVPAGRRRRRRRGEPVRPGRGHRSRSTRRSPTSGPTGRRCSPWAVTTPSRCRSCARWPATTARSPCCTSTPTSTPGTPTSVPPTPTARRSAGPARRACSTWSAACTWASAVRCTPTPTSRTTPALGFQIVRADDYETDGVRRCGRPDAAPARRRAGVRVDRHRRARPGARPGHRDAGGRRADQPRAAQHAARPGRARTSSAPTSSRSRPPTTTPRSPASPPPRRLRAAVGAGQGQVVNPRRGGCR